MWVLTCSKRDIRKLLNIPLHWKIVSIVPFGYYDPDDKVNVPRRSRKPLNQVAYLNGLDQPIG